MSTTKGLLMNAENALWAPEGLQDPGWKALASQAMNSLPNIIEKPDKSSKTHPDIYIQNFEFETAYLLIWTLKTFNVEI